MQWIHSLNKALQYIETHICESLTPSEIAEAVYLSGFHFQRVFSLMTGITLGEYIRNRRLSLAAMELRQSDVKVIDIAFKYGYETPESFTKAFTRFHGVTPMNAKKEGVILKSYAPLILKIRVEGGQFMDYRIESKEAFEVIGMRRSFDEKLEGHEIPAFWDEFFKAGHGTYIHGMFGICHELKEGRFDYSIADVYDGEKPVKDGFEVFKIPALTWAIFTCVGSMPQAIQAMWKRVYEEWLPSSDFDLMTGYDIEMYTEGDVQSDTYVSEIWIPVVKRS